MATTTPNADRVSRVIDMRILIDPDGSVPMPCTMTFSVADPFAVSATFHSREGSVTWIFSRELLLAGLHGRSGDGDIRIEPMHRTSRSVLRLELSSPSGQAIIEGPLDQVRSFADETIDLLPPGYEWQYLNFDAGLAALLNDGSPDSRYDRRSDMPEN
jgi:hypothetical protein